MPRELIKHQL